MTIRMLLKLAITKQLSSTVMKRLKPNKYYPIPKSHFRYISF